MKRLLPILALLALAGAGVAYYLWNKPHQNMQTAKADLALDAAKLFEAYNADETGSNALYLEKIIAVTGRVKEVKKNEDGTTRIMLDTGQDFGVSCELDALSKHPRTDFTIGETVVFKGTCTGLNFDVQLARCVEVR